MNTKNRHATTKSTEESELRGGLRTGQTARRPSADRLTVNAEGDGLGIVDTLSASEQGSRVGGDARVLRLPDQGLTGEQATSLSGPSHAAQRLRGASERYRSIAICLALTDALCVAGTLLIAHVVQFGASIEAGYAVVIGTAIPILWLVFKSFGLYAPQHLSGSEEFRRIIGASSVSVMLLVLTTYWIHQQVPRTWVALTWILAVLLEMVARRLWRRAIWLLRKTGRLSFRTLIIGANEEAGRLAENLSLPGLGFTPVAYVSVSHTAVPKVNHLPVAGGIESLRELIEDYSIDCLFVASTAVRTSDVLQVMTAARQSGVEVRLSANLPELVSSRLSVQPVGSVITLSLKPVRLTGAQSLVKRVFDCTAASLGVLLTLPLWLTIAAAIRLTSPGPVLFRQERVTKGGSTFRMYKFRTMVQDADSLSRNLAVDPTRPFFKIQHDPRLTSIGRFLRRYSLDELPQLLNVIKGDMSLVGPRPLPADQVIGNLDLLRPRHEVRAGVTGWWQVNGRSDVRPEEAIRLDVFYIENWSLGLDLYILLKTFAAVTGRRGAY